MLQNAVAFRIEWKEWKGFDIFLLVYFMFFFSYIELNNETWIARDTKKWSYKISKCIASYSFLPTFYSHVSKFLNATFCAVAITVHFECLLFVTFIYILAKHLIWDILVLMQDIEKSKSCACFLFQF